MHRIRPSSPSRTTPLWHGALLIALGMMQACATAPTPPADSPSPKDPAPVSHTIIVTDSAPSVIQEARLTVSLLEVNDTRCPKNVRCVWAGHAIVTLQVASDGAAPETLIIGTQAPADMQLPSEADYGKYRFSLVTLEPERASDETVPLSNYRATVQVTKR